MGCSRQEGTDQYYPTRAKWLSPVALTHCLLFQVACAKKLLLGQLNATGEDTVDLTLKALQEILTGPAARFSRAAAIATCRASRIAHNPTQRT